MKVLMFGWEYPPHISGGLGTACAGLTGALEREKVKILFVIPKLRGDETTEHTTFINASSVPIRRTKAIPSPTSSITEATPGPGSGKFLAYARGRQTILEVPAYLSAYSLASAGGFGLEQWNYSFAATAERTTPASLRRHRTPDEDFDAGRMRHAAVREPYPFSGSYDNVMEEVELYARAGSEIARQYSFDLIHAHDWMTYPAAIAAKKISVKPLVVHVHATEVDRTGSHGNPAIFATEKKGMEVADKVVTVSYWTKKITVKHYGIDGKKVEVVHNGIAPKTGMTQQPSLPPVSARIVTFLGRITRQKGPMYFVEAARLVHEKFPDAHFVVAGSGDEFPKMIERIAQLRLSTHFHFTGFLRGEEVDRVWSMSTVYVMPSVSEPFGIAPLEAIQAGVPVILSRQAGVAEVMPDAIKVDFWNREALADAICNVLRFRSLANTLRKNSAEQIKDLTWDKAAKKLTRLYDELT